MSEKNQIWIIDDHELFSAGMRQVLSSIVSNDTITCFPDPQLAMNSGDSQLVKLLLMDYHIPGHNILNWINTFVDHIPNATLGIVSASLSPKDKYDSLNAGADFFLEKNHRPEIALSVIKTAMDSSSNQPHKQTPKPAQVKPTLGLNLTDRQMDVLILIARGNSNKKIAEKLQISPETVKSHLAHIYDKLSLPNRDEASNWARNHGLV